MPGITQPPPREDPLRTLVHITTLLLAAVAGAQPAREPVPAEDGPRPVELRDEIAGRRLVCSCRYTGGYAAATCEQCTPKATEPQRSSIRLLSVRNESERALWDRLLTDLRADETINELTSQVGLQGHRVTGGEDPENAWFSFRASFRCRSAPSNADRFERFDRGDLSRSAIVAGLRAETERACRRSERADTEPQTMWAGCPAADDHDRGGSNRTANPKIRITATPDSHQDEWARLRLALVFDDLIYHCSRELLIDPVSASGTGERAGFRANVALICANDPTRRADFDTVIPEMNRGAFRRFIGEMLKRTCGLPATTASRGAR